MFELSKMFLLCLNYWKLETPTQYRQRSQKDDGTAYKVDYTRCAHGQALSEVFRQTVTENLFFFLVLCCQYFIHQFLFWSFLVVVGFACEF